MAVSHQIVPDSGSKAWLQKLSLPEIDRLEVDLLLEEWSSIEEQIQQVDAKIVERASRKEPDKLFTPAQILMTAPGVSFYSVLGYQPRSPEDPAAGGSHSRCLL